MDLGGVIAFLTIISLISGIAKNFKKAQKNRPGNAAAEKKPVHPYQSAPQAPDVSKPPENPPQKRRFSGIPKSIMDMLDLDEDEMRSLREAFSGKSEPEAMPKDAFPEDNSPATDDREGMGALNLSETARETSEGKSYEDASGCVGGTLPHISEQGSCAPPPRAQYSGTALVQETGLVRPRYTAEELRKAMVTAEILARPVALRPRGYHL